MWCQLLGTHTVLLLSFMIIRIKFFKKYPLFLVILLNSQILKSQLSLNCSIQIRRVLIKEILLNQQKTLVRNRLISLLTKMRLPINNQNKASTVNQSDSENYHIYLLRNRLHRCWKLLRNSVLSIQIFLKHLLELPSYSMKENGRSSSK